MPTAEFSKIIFDNLSKWISDGHHNLELSVPVSGSFPLHGRSILGPDIIVTNPKTGRVLGIEIKAGERELPIGLYPRLKLMKENLSGFGDFIVLSDAKPSDVLSNNVASAGISFLKIDDPAKAITALEPKLNELAAATASI
jgi:hypothetical protein